MAVKSLAWLAVTAVSLPAASGMAREQPFARSPAQTPAPMLREGGIDVSPLAVTALPNNPRDLAKRGTKTCGYVDGNPRSDYVCAHPEAECLYDDEEEAVGCCRTESCLIWAHCIPYTSSRATRTYDAERTLYCSNSNLPHCAVFSYGETTGSLAGFTIHTCDSVSTTYTIFFRPTTSSESSRTSETSETSESTAESTDESTTSDIFATTTDRDSPSETNDNNDNDDDDDDDDDDDNNRDRDSGSSTPVGPIVGGVVGGVAALGLIGLGAFFLIRRKKSNPPAPMGMVGQPGGHPGGPGGGYMGIPPGGPSPHGPSPYGPPPASPHSVMSTPVYDPYDPLQNSSGHAGSIHPMQNIPPMNSPPAGTPSPGYPYQQQFNGMGMGTPPPQHNGMGTPPPMGMGIQAPPPQNGGYMPYPGHQQKMPMQMQPVELPTQKGDGELHELS